MDQVKRNYYLVTTKFSELYHAEPSHFFMVPGRVELIGNHTDHQGGKTLSFTINRYIFAAVRKRDDNLIILDSKNFAGTTEIDVTDVKYNSLERGKSSALIRGIINYFVVHGWKVGGFNFYTSSSIPRGMGLSSSAAFELLIARILNTLFNEGKISPLDLAKAGQYAESTYFGKPSGLLDQLTVSYEEIVYADFSKPSPVIKTLDSKVFNDLDIFIINTGKSHGSLTEHYKAIVDDMAVVANHYKKRLLSEVNENTFKADYAALEMQIPRISLERATHYFRECHRVEKAVKDLEEGNLDDFLFQLNESGKSSNELLHNLTYPGDKDKTLQTMYLKLKELFPNAAVRVHGGGFAGTILVIARKEDHIGPALHEFINAMKRKKVLDIAPSKHYKLM